VHFYSFAIISPWRRATNFIWTNLRPLPPRMICLKSRWNWPSGSGEEVENVKVYRQTDGRTNDGQPAIRIAHLSFQLRWAKNDTVLNLIISSSKCWLHKIFMKNKTRVSPIIKNIFAKWNKTQNM
jgi:hypothetical protein